MRHWQDKAFSLGKMEAARALGTLGAEAETQVEFCLGGCDNGMLESGQCVQYCPTDTMLTKSAPKAKQIIDQLAPPLEPPPLSRPSPGPTPCTSYALLKKLGEEADGAQRRRDWEALRRIIFLRQRLTAIMIQCGVGTCVGGIILSPKEPVKEGQPLPCERRELAKGLLAQRTLAPAPQPPKPVQPIPLQRQRRRFGR